MEIGVCLGQSRRKKGHTSARSLLSRLARHVGLIATGAGFRGLDVCTRSNFIMRDLTLSCEVCGRTIELVPDDQPLYKNAIEAGWRLEYHGAEREDDAPRVSAKCDICRTHNIRHPDFSEPLGEHAS